VSEANVEGVRRAYEAWNRRDYDAFTDVAPRMSPNWEFTLHGGQLVGLDRTYRGRDGFQKFVDDWVGAWETLNADVHRIIDVDDERVLGLCHLRGVARAGMELEIEYAHLSTIVDGTYMRLDGYPSWELGLRAAGLDPAVELKD
jgi:ketosteroid isomerase-like protein